MIYITGDPHGDFRNIARFCKKMQTSKEDVLIILGDAGINYYGPEQDKRKKKYLESLPITIETCAISNFLLFSQQLSFYYVSRPASIHFQRKIQFLTSLGNKSSVCKYRIFCSIRRNCRNFSKLVIRYCNIRMAVVVCILVFGKPL